MAIAAPYRTLGTVLASIALASCASVPVFDESTGTTHSVSSIQIFGSRGALSQKQSRAILNSLAAQFPDAGALERHIALEQAIAASPLFSGNQVKILRDGGETFPATFAAIRAARHFLYLEYYIFENVSCDGEQLSDLLIAKSREGVRIQIIYDGIGSIGTPSGFFDDLRAAGVQVLQFNPPNPLKAGWRFSLNDRDHRKILIADGEVAIMGGVNLSSTYQSGIGARVSSQPPQAPRDAQPPEVWHDTDLEISGPVVAEFEKLFEQHWRQQQGPPMEPRDAASPSPIADPPGNEVIRVIGSEPGRLTSRYYATVLSAIRNAESSIRITAAYFVPTHQEIAGLVRAARRGVDVQLLLPSRSDSSPALQVQHSHYSKLLRAGVKIYERDDGILHSKTMVVDGVWSIVGSSNFDHRSVLFNDEVDAVVLGSETGRQLSALFQSDLSHAQPIDLTSWRQRSLLTQWREQFWRLWEKLL